VQVQNKGARRSHSQVQAQNSTVFSFHIPGIALFSRRQNISSISHPLYCWGDKRSRSRRTGYAGVMKSSEAWMKEDESRFDPDRKKP
jgi:hypothetical protein